MKKTIIVSTIVVLLTLSGCAKTEPQNVDNTAIVPLSPSAAVSEVAAEAPALSPTTTDASLDSLEKWTGDYWFSEKSADDHYIRYEISIYKDDDDYIAHFYIFGYRIMNEFRASVTGNESSVNLIFKEYVDDNYTDPFNKGDLLLTLKRDNDKLLTGWEKIQPMLKENESGKENFKKSAGSGSALDSSNKEVRCLRNTVLVNELNSNDNQLFYLGMTRDDLLAVLSDNDIYYYTMESDPGPAGASPDNDCLYYFELFEDTIGINVVDDTVASIEMRGSIPLKAASTQAGLFLGDSLDKMIELYGDGYAVGVSPIPGEEMYKAYVYKVDDYQFYVYFLNDVVARWGVSTNEFAYIG